MATSGDVGSDAHDHVVDFYEDDAADLLVRFMDDGRVDPDRSATELQRRRAGR